MCSVAAPIFGHENEVLGAIGVSVPTFRFSTQKAEELSEKLGIKDKIELVNIEGDQRFYARLALIASTIVIREIVEDKETEHKLSVQFPQVVGMILCDNKNCVTNSEVVTRRFDIEQAGVITKLRCVYCERIQENLIFED